MKFENEDYEIMDALCYAAIVEIKSKKHWIYFIDDIAKHLREGNVKGMVLIGSGKHNYTGKGKYIDLDFNGENFEGRESK